MARFISVIECSDFVVKHATKSHHLKNVILSDLKIND